MEFTSLLRSGKPGGFARTTATTTIATTVLRVEAAAGGGGGADDCEDEGPFFDLDFAAPMDEEERRGKGRYALESDSDSESDESASESGSVRRDHILSLSPSDDLFFKGRLLPLEPSARLSRSSSSASSSKPQVAAFLLKSAAKLRVFKLGLRKKGQKSTPVDISCAASPAATADSPKHQHQQQHRSKFFVKFNVEDEPAASIFTRDSSSSRSSGSSRSARLFSHDGLSPSEDKKMTKDVLHRYLNKIKPLYVRVSKRYGEMLRFSGPLNAGGAGKVRPAAEGGDAAGSEKDGAASTSANGPSRCERPQNGSIPSGLKVVGRRLRKSRSASAAVNAVRSPAPARRDDSLLAQQDGIQSAIAHCKRSFNRGSDSSEPPLTRSMSEPGNARTAEASAKGDV